MRREALKLLSDYLRIDTSNPPGNEVLAADFFEKIFIKENIAWKKYQSEPGRVSIRAVIPGSGRKKPVILLNHTDVVPADQSNWSFEPFSGEITDTHILGRGALDMKGLGIMELMAFLSLKRQGVKPCRDVIFLAVADEEAGGKYGAQHLLENHQEDFQAGLVLNEGGFGFTDFLANRPVFMITSAEKGPCWLRLTCKGPQGHGSMPHDQNALEALTKSLNRVLAHESELTATPVVKEFFLNLAEDWQFLEPFKKSHKSEDLTDCLAKGGLMNMPDIRAMFENTISLNTMQAGEKANVIPAKAEAQLDARLLPGQDPSSFIEKVKGLLGNRGIQIEATNLFPATSSPTDTPDYQILTLALKKHHPGAAVTPALSVGTTDSRFFRRLGMDSYGFFPILINRQDFKGVHGADERLLIKSFKKGCEIYDEVLRELCL